MHLVPHRSDCVRRPYRISSRFRPFLNAEHLEARELLSAAPVAAPNVTVVPDLTVIPAVSSSTVPGMSPSQIKQAYNFTAASGTGAGQTIAIVDAYNDPNIKSDLATFSSQFGLPFNSSQLSVVGETGSSAALPASDAGWSQEIALDVEWAHAIAPAANILLVEASSANTNDLATAIKYASQHANVVSMSWGGPEFFGENRLDSLFNVPGVTFVASAGDVGGQVSWPASSPYVVGVGGTSLSTSSAGAYLGESGWVDSGGGLSVLEPQPSYQAGVPALSGVPVRATPDVAYNADPSTGMAVYDSYQNPNSQSGWFQVGGTSAGAPQWSALFADANGIRGTSNSSLQTLTQLYSLGTNATTAANDFHDVQSGFTFGFTFAQPGYDLITGLGSPNANNLIAALAGTTTTTTGSGSGSGTSSGGTTGTGTGSTGGTTGGSTGGSAGGGQTGGGTGGGTTGGGTHGGRHHHQPPFFLQPTSPTSAPVFNLLVTSAPLGTPVVVTAVSGSGSASVAVSAATSQPVVTQAPAPVPSTLARPVQPFSDQMEGLIGSSSESQESAIEVGDVAVPAPAKGEQPVAPAKPEDAPPAAPVPKENAENPVETGMLMRSWDDAVAEYVADSAGQIPIPVPVETEANADEEHSLTGTQTLLMAGAAVAIWGTWEVRSRRSERRSRNWFLKRSDN